ncbi:MAG TPA: hypothetical protein VF956_05485 [Candidatus Dormibacteraeota bacterium]
MGIVDGRAGWVFSSAGLLPLLSARGNVWLAGPARDAGATRSGTAILLATHDQAVVEVADRVLSMEDARLADAATERAPAPA